MVQNRDKQREADKRWRAAHPGAVKQQKRRYYEKKREEVLSRTSAYYHENKEFVNMKNRLINDDSRREARNTRRHWSQVDYDIFATLLSKGLTLQQIAYKMGRSIFALKHARMKLKNRCHASK